MKKHESRLSRDILLEQMRRLACAKVNDAVKLAYLPEEERESTADWTCCPDGIPAQRGGDGGTEIHRPDESAGAPSGVERTQRWRKQLEQLFRRMEDREE